MPRCRKTAATRIKQLLTVLPNHPRRRYIEGKNLVIEWRFAYGKYERLPGLAAELVRVEADVIVSHGTQGTLAAIKATSTIPIVFPSASYPPAYSSI